MADTCSGQVECWQLSTDEQKSPQRGEIMAMFENLLATIFCRDMDSLTKDAQSSAITTGSEFDLEAVDNKIKDALQIMKTNLSFAIREEVDILKVKITDLEMKIDELKLENKLLREYAPDEILKQLEEILSPIVRSPIVEQPASHTQIET